MNHLNKQMARDRELLEAEIAACQKSMAEDEAVIRGLNCNRGDYDADLWERNFHQESVLDSIQILARLQARLLEISMAPYKNVPDDSAPP